MNLSMQEIGKLRSDGARIATVAVLAADKSNAVRDKALDALMDRLVRVEERLADSQQALRDALARLGQAKPPVINVAAPKVEVAGPRVEVAAPKVEVAAPHVNVEAPAVTVKPQINMPTPPRKWKFTHEYKKDGFGPIATYAEAQE